MKRRRAPSINVHVSNRESEAIGLSLGRKIGLLDATTQPTSSGKFDKGKWDVLHRQLTVVDSYSAAVDIDALQRGRVNVLIQALGAEELFVRIPTADEDGLPPRGVKFWKHAFEGAELVERVGHRYHRLRGVLAQPGRRRARFCTVTRADRAHASFGRSVIRI